MKKERYDVALYGYRIRTNADFNRVDMSKAQRNKHHRKIKLKKKDILREEKII